MPENLLKVIKSRRSVRAYTNDPIPPNMLNLLLEALRWAPSAANMQPWFFYAVKDKEKIKSLSQAVRGQEFIANAPLVFVICSDPGRSARVLGERGRRYFCLQDTASAAQNLAIVAHSAGLGTCWVGSFDDMAVREVLDIPSHLDPVAVIPCGFPAQEHEPIPDRRPLEEVSAVIE